MHQKYKKSTNLIKNTVLGKNNNNEHILDILTEYTQKYIYGKESANLSEKTIYNTKIILERFYDFVADELAENESLTINNINKYFLNNYLNRLTTENINKNTQKLHLTIIKGFISFIADSDVKRFEEFQSNIKSINTVKIKTEQKEKDSFSQSEQKRLLDYIANLDKKNTYLAQRNSLLIKILLYTGIRISELTNIKWSDITEHNDDTHGIIHIILIKGKGNKERYSYLLDSEVANNLKFLKRNNNIYLFTTTHGNQCNRSMLFIVIKHLLEKAGVYKSGIHIFRHTFARSLVSKEVNLSTIKDLLGHSNITVTAQFYAKSDEKAKKNALFKV